MSEPFEPLNDEPFEPVGIYMDRAEVTASAVTSAAEAWEENPPDEDWVNLPNTEVVLGD